MNIPIYRAKEKKTNRYIIGYEFYNHIEDEYYITHQLTGNNYKVDKSTLSIHFPDMIDSQGNKIFASLQEDGKGGDVLNSGYGEVVIAIYEEGMIKFRFEEALPYNHTTIDKIEDENFLSFYEVWQIRDKLESEVIGIQE